MDFGSTEFSAARCASRKTVIRFFMSYLLRVGIGEGGVYLFAKNLTWQEYCLLNQITLFGTHYSAWKALLVVLRTDSKEHLLGDLFFPSILNLARRIDKLSHKVLAAIGLFFVDLASLPFRIVTLPARGAYNHFRNPRLDHPLYCYLAVQGASRDLINADHLRVNLVGPMTDSTIFVRSTD